MSSENPESTSTFVTVAERYREGRLLRHYVLRHDAGGWFWPGLTTASWRRKTRQAAERYANRLGFAVFDTEVKEA